jgi:flagellar biosynthetic protein FliQ
VRRARDAGNIPADQPTRTRTLPEGSASVSGGRAPFPSGTRGALKEEWWGMDLSQATELIRHTLLTALIVSAPMLVIGLAVGIVVSLLQAVTQIQEQTLTFVPKIVAMVAAAIVLMPWIGRRLLDYSAAMFLGQ